MTAEYSDISRDYFAGAAWTKEGKKQVAAYEEQYRLIKPFVEQTERWQSGMRYRFTPKMWSINQGQVNKLKKVGLAVGELLRPLTDFEPIGFRLDMIQDEQNNFWVTEIQTDDRGLPEMAILRNAYNNPKDFTGVVEGFIEAIKTKFPQARTAVIAFPDNEYFYYAAFYDFAKLCRAACPNLGVWTIPNSELVDCDGSFKSGGYPRIIYTPDVVYDFTGKISGNKTCFKPVDKELLARITNLIDNGQLNTPNLKTLRRSIPPTYTSNVSSSKDDKNDWVIKPINERWSKGVIFGFNTRQSEWQQSVAELINGKTVIQRFIRPRAEWFPVRTESRGEASYPETAFLLRVEGYYFLARGQYKLADIMVTGREDLPVHGQRDCIMVPAIIK